MSKVPNLPSLSANGSSATKSDTSTTNRSLNRPYSAKTVYFFKEGDEFFPGVRVPITKHRYRTLESLLDDLNDKVPLYFGVRRVFTPTGKREVRSIDELQNYGKYVCASSKWTKGLMASDNYHQWKERSFENEKLFLTRRQRSDNSFGGAGGLPLGHAAAAVAAAETTKARISRRLIANSQAPRPFLHDSVAGQQVLFALNGLPNRVYRMQFRQNRLPQFDDVLGELSEMLHVPVAKLYTPDGQKVSTVAEILAHGHLQLLAYQKHERPTIAGKLAPLAIANGIPGGKKPPAAAPLASRPLRARQQFAVAKMPTHTAVQPLPQITSSSTATAESAEKKNSTSKRIRRRTISKRKRKKVTDVGSEAGGSDSSSIAEKTEAAIKIQATFRGFRARKKLEAKTRMLGDMDEESEEVKRAAVVIQAGVKGYLARKKYRVTKSRAQTATLRSDLLLLADAPLDPIDLEARSHAATAIQAAYRGQAARRRLLDRSPTKTNGLEAAAGEMVNGHDESIEEPPAKATTEQRTASSKTKSKDVTKKKTTTIKKKKQANGDCTYRISIYVGNRWAADSDADLYVILHGEKGDSKKLVLKQSAEEPRFQQNQMDSFDVEAPYVGLLKKLTAGHENKGYGAGIFIDRIVITELQIDSLQYFFPCAKWFDSGQVDGKLERVCPCTGYQTLTEQNVSAALDGDRSESQRIATKGRWTIRLHVEKCIPEKFKAQLYLTAYGTFGRSEMIPFPDDFEAEQGAECSFNVEFGDLGDLFKIRFDSEQSTEHAWLLEWVEMKDVDTGDVTRMTVGKWFCQKAPNGVKLANAQTFREISVLRIGIEPLPTFQYNLTLLATKNRQGCTLPIVAQLTGEFGDSGACVLPVAEKAKPEELQITIESISLGRLMFVSINAPVTEKGDIYSESFRALQEIYDRHNAPAPVAPDWLIKKAVVRESTHAPYQFIFGESRIVEPETPGNVKKQLTLTEMEGLSTMNNKSSKPSKSKIEKPKAGKLAKSDSAATNSTTTGGGGGGGQWRVFVTTGEHTDGGTDCTPYLIVYGEEGVSKPIPLLDKKQRFTPGSVCQFDIALKNIGRIFKIRVRLDTSGPNPMWYLKRIKMKDQSNGDELRFPVEMWLEKNDDNPEVSVELPAVWPDVPPLPSVLYNVTLCTGTESDNDTDFDVYLIIFGRKGDTGKRFLRSPVGTQESSCLKPGNVDTFEVEAVSVRDITKVQIGVEPRKKSASWNLDRVEISDPESEHLYIFPCGKWFSDSKGDQKLERLLTPESILDGTE